MPFLNDEQPAGLATQAPEPVQTTTALHVASASEMAQAALGRQASWASALLAANQPGMSPADPTFDPFKDIKGYEDYAASFIGANSDEDVYRVKHRIDEEYRRDRVLESAGIYGDVAQLAAGMADPVTFIPIGGEVVRASRFGRIAVSAGRVAAGAAVGTAAQEAILHATQETRTGEESALNIAAATLLGGVLGGAVSAIGRPVSREMAAGVARDGAVYGAELGGNIGAPAVEGAPPPAPGMTRMYHGGGNQAPDGMPRHFSSSLAYAQGYADKTPGGTVTYVDIPTNDPLIVPDYPEQSIAAGFHRQIELPVDIADQRQPLGSPGGAAVGGSVGAAAARDTTLEQETFTGALGAEKALAFSSPTMRLGSSPSVEVRRLAQELAEQPLELRKNVEGIASPVSVESRIRLWQAPLAEAATGADDAFVRYRLGRAQKVGDQFKLGVADTFGQTGGKLSYGDFMDAVSYAMRRNDQHEIPEVAQAAKLMRETLFDPLKNRAIEAGQLPEDVSVDTALSYLTRVYDVNKIVARRPEFEQILTNWLTETQGQVAERVAGFEKLRTQSGSLVEKATGALTEKVGQRPAAAEAVKAEGAFKTVDEQMKLADRAHRKARKDLALAQDREHEATFSQGNREGNPAAKARLKEIELNVRQQTREADALAEKIKALQPEWDRLKLAGAGASDRAKALEQEIAQHQADIDKHSKIVARMDKLIEEHRVFARSDVGDLKDMSRQITDTLLHQSPGRTLYTPVPLTRGPLRERTLNIPDAQIESFLESDIGRVARIYTRTMGADTELAKMFGRADMEGQFATVNEHYAQLRAAAEAKGTTEAARNKINNQQKADLRDLSAVRDRIRGTYGLPENPNGLWSRAYTIVRDLNYLRLMGGMTLSSLSDMGSIVMVHGMQRVFGEGLVPMIRDFGRYRLSSSEAKLSGSALDMVLDTRAMSIADVLDDYGRHSKFERGLQAMTGKFGLVTLMAPWNAVMKQFAGVISQTRALKAITTMAAGEATKPAEVTRLAKLGIGPGTIERISAMFEKHGSRDSNIWWANTKAWEDTEAADVFRAAMGKEIDMAVVSPGQERPLWMTKGVGKVIGQFRSFSMASTQRILVSGLQRRDMATLNGFAMMTALGMLTFFAKEQMGGRGDKLPGVGTPGEMGKWISEGLDRGGLSGWLFDANNMIEKLSSGAVGMSRLTGQPTMSRYASRGVLSAILGPTAGWVEGLAGVTQSLGRGDWSASDSHAVRQMIPLQNLIGVRHLFDAAEQGINHAFGVPDKKPAAN